MPINKYVGNKKYEMPPSLVDSRSVQIQLERSRLQAVRLRLQMEIYSRIITRLMTEIRNNFIEKEKNKQISIFKSKYNVDFPYLETFKQYTFPPFYGTSIFLAYNFLENFNTYPQEEREKYTILPFYTDADDKTEIVGYIVSAKEKPLYTPFPKFKPEIFKFTNLT